jgi:hypothetical protein
MIDASHKSAKARATPSNYCEALGRACRSKACDFGCKLLRERARHPAGLPAAHAMADAAVPETGEGIVPAVRQDPVTYGPESSSELTTESTMLAGHQIVPPAAAKPTKRRTRGTPEGQIDLSSLASDNHLSVLKAALAGLEQVDVIMSMSARMLGIAQAGTALDTLRETKRRLAALIAEVTRADSRTET